MSQRISNSRYIADFELVFELIPSVWVVWKISSSFILIIATVYLDWYPENILWNLVFNSFSFCFCVCLIVLFVCPLSEIARKTNNKNISSMANIIKFFISMYVILMMFKILGLPAIMNFSDTFCQIVCDNLWITNISLGIFHISFPAMPAFIIGVKIRSVSSTVSSAFVLMIYALFIFLSFTYSFVYLRISLEICAGIIVVAPLYRIGKEMSGKLNW